MAKIEYVKMFSDNRSNSQLISHDMLDLWDSYDFNENGLCEILKDQQYRRLYFDFDDIKSRAELTEVAFWINGLATVFGRYCEAGYTTIEDLKSLPNMAYIEDTKGFKYHSISMHVVFPDTCIDNNELYEIMHSGKYITNRFVDTKVYKETGKQQLLRHPYAPKNDRPVGFDFIERNMQKPSNLVATCKGKERKVTRDEWIKVFPKVAEVLHSSEDAIDELINDVVENFDETKSSMTKELFETLYKGFDGLMIHGDAEKTEKEISLFPLFSALFACKNENVDDDDIDDALDFIKDNADLTDNAKLKWSEKRKQAKKNDKCTGPGALFNYLKNFNSDYYNVRVKPLIPKKKVEAKFDLKDEFLISDIRDKFGQYQLNGSPEKLDYNAILTDLRRVMIIVDSQDGLFVFKVRDSKNNKMTLEFASRTAAYNRLKDLKVGTEAKVTKTETKLITKTAFDVIDASNNNASFYKNSVCFFSENPKDFSFFQGYKYEPVLNDALIEKFNEHIMNIWCKGDEKLYQYVQSWFATIVQEPLNRAYTALVIKGEEGLGKNTVTDVWSELLAGYSNSNVSDINTIIGHFNSGIENKKLLVMNEMDSVDMNSKAIFNGLKKLITEDTIDINEKNIKVRPDVQNVSNLIILSNEFNPVKLSSKDRRYCVINPSEDKVGDRKYFKELYSTMKESRHKYRKDFMEALMHYYMNYKVEIDLEDIPDTFEREMLKEANKNPIESFIEAHCVDLSNDGIEPKKCWDEFNAFIAENKFKANYKLNSFRAEMSKYCKFDSDGKQSKYNGKRVYRFTDVMITKYAKLVESVKQEEEDNVEDAY